MLHEGDVVGVIAVKLIGVLIHKLHGEPECEGVFRARLAQAFKLLHAINLGQFAGRLKKRTLRF